MVEDHWTLDDSADRPWWKARRGDAPAARPESDVVAGPQAVRIVRMQRRYAYAVSLGTQLDVLIDDIRERFPFQSIVAIAGFEGRGVGRGAGASAAEVDAFVGSYLLHPPTGRPEPAEAASPLAALRSWRSGVVVPAPSFGTSFVAAVAVDADAGHPAIDEVRAALEVAAPFLARGAELHALRRHARETEAQRVRSARALDALPDAVLVMDPDALVLMTNRRAADLLVVSAGDDEARRAAVQRNNLFFSAFRARTLLARAGHRASRELVLMDPREGRDRIFEVVMLPLPSADGRSEDSLFVLRDVTDLGGANHELEILAARASAAEHEARREADRLSAILDDVAVPVLVTDRRTDVTLMNREAERLLTSGTADVVADGETERIFRSNGLELAGFIQASLLAPRPRRQARLTLVDPGGSRLAVRAVSTRVPDRNDEGATLVTVLHDLTPRLENRKLAQKLRRLNVDLEERIAEATRELASRNTELVKQRAELLQASRMKTEFLATMSHELRTPINAILGYNSLLREGLFGDLTDRQQDSLQRMRGAAEHLLSIINDILDLSRVEAGKVQLTDTDVDLVTLLPRFCNSMQPLAERKGITYVTDIDPDLPVVRTDWTRLGQVMLNLLSNAVKFTERGSVTLRAQRAGAEGVRIDVVDTGIGIPAEHLDSIFEEFTQVDRLWRREQGGTGLGLPISRKLVALLGGRLMVSSEAGSGTTFTVELPLVPPEREAGDRLGPDAPHQPRA